MFEAIFIPAVLVAGFGLLAGVGLSIATIVFATPGSIARDQLRCLWLFRLRRVRKSFG